jgi:pyruvate kinase
MKRIVARIEAEEDLPPAPAPILKTHKDRLLSAAARLAEGDHHSSIVVFTRNGNLPAVLSALRPRHSPIYAFTDSEQVFKHLLLHWGVEPFLMEFSKDYEQTILDAFAYLKRRNWVEIKDWVVVVTNVIMGEKLIDTIQFREVE